MLALVDAIVLTADRDELRIELKENLAAMGAASVSFFVYRRDGCYELPGV